MENCLVTKYKAAVTSDNLPTLDTIVLDDFDKAALPNQPRILITPGNDTVTVTSKVLMYQSNSYTEGTGVYSLTLSANVRKLLYFKKADIEALSSIKDFLTITGSGIYGIKGIGDTFFKMNNTLKSNLSSQEYNSSLIAYGSKSMNEPIQDLPSNIEFIITGKFLDAWWQLPSLKVIATGSGGGDLQVPLCELSAANTTVQTMQFVAGDVKYLPKNILTANLTYETKGSIEQLVESMVNKGRTSGSIKFSSTASTQVTYNNKRLGSEESVAERGGDVLVWNGTTITWQAADTEETAAAPSTSMYTYLSGR